MSGEQSAHSAGEDRQPAGLRGLRAGSSGSMAGIQGGQKKATFDRNGSRDRNKILDIILRWFLNLEHAPLMSYCNCHFLRI